MLDQRSLILSAPGLFLLEPFLPESCRHDLKRLYSSKSDGHSLNRLGHCIIGYKGPTLALFKDQMQRIIGVLNYCEWRDSHMFQGDQRAVLFTLAPRFSCVRVLDPAKKQGQANSNYLYLNTSLGKGMSKTKFGGGQWPVKGMGAGGEGGHLRLSVDENLEGIQVDIYI